MAKKRRPTRESKRFKRNSTRKHNPIPVIAHPKRILTVVLSVILIVTAALITGNYLKNKSDRHRAELEKNEWTVDESAPPLYPVSVPAIRAHSLHPDQSSDAFRKDYGGVLIPLNQGQEVLFQSAIASEAGLKTGTSDASALVERLHKEDFHVTGVFTVQWFCETDSARSVYLRGLELSLLREFADAGFDDFLLMGLPSSPYDPLVDQRSVTFLSDLKHILADANHVPALGVTLPLSAFHTDSLYGQEEGEDLSSDAEVPLYAGRLTPSRFLTACDYLTMDLTALSATETEATLPEITYAYTRYSLRLLMSADNADAVNGAWNHGFERLLEWQMPLKMD